MALSEEDKAKAAAIVGGWAWQIADGHNYRYRYATRTLTRFYEAAGMQPDEVRLVVEFLRDQEIAAGEGISILNRVIDFGDGWKAKDAWYQTAPGERFANTDSTKVRVYQILFQAPEDADADGPYSVENGCAYKSTHSFYWDVEELPSLPASSSGVEYAMRGVTRDRETGLFSCVVERRERVQQDVAEYLSAKTVFEERKVEQHLGVKAGSLSAAGKSASAGGGTIVTRRISKNADCTSDVTNETTVETAASGAATSTHVSLTGTTTRTVNRNMADKASESGLGVGESVENVKTDGGRWNQTIVKVDRSSSRDVLDTCQKTVFEHSHGKVTVQGAKPGFTDVAEAAGGKVQKKTVRLTEDGSYRVEDETNTEISVSGAVERTSVGLDGTTKTTVNRNMANKADTSSLDIGSSVENAKTEGGRWTQTVTTFVASDARQIAKGCRKTLFEHSHTTTDVQGTDPGFTDAASASGGVITEKSVRRTATGAYQVEEHKTTETPVASAVVETRRTVSGTTTTTLDRNQPSPASTTGLAVGQSVRVEKTPGGLYNNQRTTTQASNTTLQTGSEDSGGVVHTDSTVKNEASAKSGLATAGANTVRRIVSRLNENGTYDNETRTTTYATRSETASGGSQHAQTTVTSTINATDVPTVTTSQNVDESVSISLNEHGSMTVSQSRTTYTPATATSQTKWATETVTTTTTRHDTTRDKEVDGEFGDTSAQPDDNGAATTSTSVYEPKEVDSGWLEWESENKTPSYVYTYAHRLRVFCNIEDPSTMLPKESGREISVNVHINKFGRYDGSITTTELKKWERNTSSGGDDGGYSEGTVTANFYRQTADGRTQRQVVTMKTRTYNGTGNSASEDRDKRNAHYIQGISLPSRTYGVAEPKEGPWEAVKEN